MDQAEMDSCTCDENPCVPAACLRSVRGMDPRTGELTDPFSHWGHRGLSGPVVALQRCISPSIMGTIGLPDLYDSRSHFLSFFVPNSDVRASRSGCSNPLTKLKLDFWNVSDRLRPFDRNNRRVETSAVLPSKVDPAGRYQPFPR
jgi:hypothetical protein